MSESLFPPGSRIITEVEHHISPIARYLIGSRLAESRLSRRRCSGRTLIVAFVGLVIGWSVVGTYCPRFLDDATPRLWVKFLSDGNGLRICIRTRLSIRSEEMRYKNGFKLLACRV